MNREEKKMSVSDIFKNAFQTEFPNIRGGVDLIPESRQIAEGEALVIDEEIDRVENEIIELEEKQAELNEELDILYQRKCEIEERL